MTLAVPRWVEVLIELLQALVETVTHTMIVAINLALLTGPTLAHISLTSLLRIERHLAVISQELLLRCTLVGISWLTA